MDSRVDWIGVVVLVGGGLIVPIQAEEGSLDVATVHRASNACAVLSAFESAAATPLTTGARESRRQRNGWIGATPTTTDA